MQLELSVQQFSNCLIVHVVGGMDLSNADLARIRLTSELDKATDGVVLDLDRLEFLDAVGAPPRMCAGLADERHRHRALGT